MSKGLKTRKSIAKRFWTTGSGRLMRRRAGQDHFNAREPGKVTRVKRRDTSVTSSDAKRVTVYLPYR